jgi:hypothetical protein
MAETRKRSKDGGDQLWDTLTTVTLGLAVLVAIFYVVVFIAPSLSPFGKQEPTRVALLSTPTPKPTVAASFTPIAAPATWTPSPTPTRPTPTNSRTPTPTKTPSPTIFFTLTPTETGTPTPTRHPWPFRLSDDGVQYIRYPFSSQCDWLGIGGEVIDQEGEPIMGIAVVVNGGGLQNVVTQSGQAPDYAPSGWEHFLDNKVKEGNFTIQLWNQGQPVSEVVDVRTRRDCRANLAYLVFEVAWDDYVVP